MVNCVYFFFNDTATTEIYTLSLHDALPISVRPGPTWPCSVEVLGHQAAKAPVTWALSQAGVDRCPSHTPDRHCRRSEEHTSELQSRQYLVCRLLLEKKKKDHTTSHIYT